ncbi:Uncharacterized protein FWK35_00012624 [Aphis craccivora]|uniref:Uncharacterized protein n=1 Tax=Aphis craccivora TaxID=307492 RepID=A0A6G0YNE7_APHCR|nr:Uncharacterized protein FWK35_00012624 [Aphis craccivora]
MNNKLKMSNEKLNKKIENLLENKNSNSNKNTFFRNLNLQSYHSYLHAFETIIGNIQPQQCKICLKNDHITENCYFNNKPTITCQICYKAGHSAKTCRSINQNLKN